MPPRTKAAKNTHPDPIISPATAQSIDEALIPWFSENQRQLGFRKTRHPYSVMVSEFMLQQTTVATVEGYFPRFMTRFPTVHSLAQAPEEDVLTQWAGLGYYRRARQLHAAAKAIVSQHGGVIPSDINQLLTLPGIGRYTAGAIASTAYDIPAPILEANTIRVFSRLAGTDGIIGDTSFTNALWHVATSLVNQAQSPGNFNIAAMELGSLVCRPEPQCLLCPVSPECIAYRTGTASLIPRPAPRPSSVEVQMIGYVLSTPDGKFLVRRIPPGQWHAGMYEFPTLRLPTNTPSPTPQQAADFLRELLNLDPSGLSQFKQLRYQVTHHKITLTVFRGQIARSPGLPQTDNGQFLDLANISSLPMGSAQKKILKALIETDLISQ